MPDLSGRKTFRCPKEGVEVAEVKDHAFLKEIQAKMDRKLKESEIAILEHWKGHLDRVLSMKPEGVASLQMNIKKVSEMMNNRIKILKRE